MTERCEARQSGTDWQCGLYKGHDGAHTVLIPSEAAWFTGKEPPSLSTPPPLSTALQIAKAARAKANLLRTDPAWRKRFAHPYEQAFALDHFASDLESGLWPDWLQMGKSDTGAAPHPQETPSEP